MRKVFISLTLFVIFFFIALTNSAEAASDLYVATNGTNGGSCSQAAPCQTIAYALSVANDGDTIHVGGGNFYESVTVSKSVNIEGNPTCTPCTVWYSAPNTQLMIINNNATVTVQDFNIRGGSGSNGGAIITSSGTNVTLIDLYIYENEAYRGGAIYNRGNMVIDDTLINENKAEAYGGAIYNIGTLTIQYSRIFNNYANKTGGAIYNVGTITASQTDFTLNNAFYSGGAVYNSGGFLQFQSGDMNSNQAEHGVGGAVVNTDGGRLVVGDAEVSKNIASSPCVYFAGDRECEGGAPSGGAIYNDRESSLVLSIVELYANFTNAADEWDGRGGAVFNQGDAIIAYSSFNGNRVFTEDYNYPYNEGSSKGGALFNSGTLDVYNSTFYDNEVDSNGGTTYGGGLYNDYEGEIYIENSTITDNRTEGLGRRAGGGIYNNGQMNLIHLTISHNLVGDMEEPDRGSGSGIYNTNNLDIINSIVAMNYGDDCSGRGSFNSKGENLDSDGTCPDFTRAGKDPELGPLKNNGGPTFTRLPAASSPAIDSAELDLCLLNDQRGYNRPFGDGCDLGAVELNEG